MSKLDEMGEGHGEEVKRGSWQRRLAEEGE
jgi:hypothetical protein